MEENIEVETIENDETPQKEEVKSDETHEEEAVSEDTEAAQEEDSSEESDDSENGDSEKVKKKNGFAKRIDKFKSKLTAKEKEIEYWKQVALDSKANQSKEETEPVETNHSDSGKPNPDDFDNYEDYLEANIEFRMEQRLKSLEEKKSKEAEKSTFQKKTEDFGKKLNTFREQTPDFEEVMEEVEDIQVSKATEQLILESENGPELMYELAKSPEDLERISSLPPLMAAKEIGKIEARLQKPATNKTKTTRAPRPLSTVRGNAKVTKDLSDPNLSQREYEEIRAKQLQKRGA